jgi:hypothetical protein
MGCFLFSNDIIFLREECTLNKNYLMKIHKNPKYKSTLCKTKTGTLLKEMKVDLSTPV